MNRAVEQAEEPINRAGFDGFITGSQLVSSQISVPILAQLSESKDKILVYKVNHSHLKLLQLDNGEPRPFTPNRARVVTCYEFSKLDKNFLKYMNFNFQISKNGNLLVNLGYEGMFSLRKRAFMVAAFSGNKIQNIDFRCLETSEYSIFTKKFTNWVYFSQKLNYGGLQVTKISKKSILKKFNFKQHVHFIVGKAAQYSLSFGFPELRRLIKITLNYSTHKIRIHFSEIDTRTNRQTCKTRLSLSHLSINQSLKYLLQDLRIIDCHCEQLKLKFKPQIKVNCYFVLLALKPATDHNFDSDFRKEGNFRIKFAPAISKIWISEDQYTQEGAITELKFQNGRYSKCMTIEGCQHKFKNSIENMDRFVWMKDGEVVFRESN